MSARFVIVGASAAGVAAALELREQGFDGQVLLLGAETRLPYERPSVSKDLLMDGATKPIVAAALYEERNIELRLGVKVRRVDGAAGLVELDDGQTIRADKVLLATGGTVRKLSIPGAQLKGVHYVRSADDADAIRDGLRPGRRVVVVGGGLIGSEVAASAILRGCEVEWLEAGFRCLTRALAPPLDEALTGIHRERGVGIHVNASVTRILGSVRATGVELADGRRIDADLVVVGVGIVPATEVAVASGIRVDNGIVVDAFGATSMPNVFAAGDVACHQSRHMAAMGRLEHWRHAQQHGAAAARSMLGRGQPYDDLPWFWTDQYEHHLEGCGLPSEGDEAVLRGDLDSASATVFYLRHERLVAAATLNRPNDVRAAMRLIGHGLTPSREALRNPATDLRKLEKELKNVAA